VSDIFVQPLVDKDELRVEATLVNHSSDSANINVSGAVLEWINEAGRSVLDAPEVKWKLATNPSLELSGQSIQIAPGESQKVALTAKVNGRLKQWSPDAPNLNGLLLNLSADGKTIDTKYQRFGWRQFTMQGNQLLLNGQPITLHGDSWHFMGVPQMTRRYAYAWFQLLKDAGANAVRLHASVYPSFYHDMADEMGIMILDESAIWLSDGGPKADSDLFWKNCRSHVEELVKRDRNHPSVVLWSIGNEIAEQGSPAGHKVAAELAGIVRSEDLTRPVTAGCNNYNAAFNGFQKQVAVFGYNYKPFDYGKVRATNENLPLFGSETASCISSRGEYFFPVGTNKNGGKADFQMSSYDLYAPPWATPPDWEFHGQDQFPYVSNEFVWTDFDYLNEPTPYNSDTSNLLNFKSRRFLTEEFIPC